MQMQINFILTIPLQAEIEFRYLNKKIPVKLEQSQAGD